MRMQDRHEQDRKKLAEQTRRERRRQAIEAAERWESRPEFPARDDGDDMPKTRQGIQ